MDPELIQSFPTSPGVYLMKDKERRIIYVGKAINLKKRVLNYFAREDESRYQIRFLMNRVDRIECIVTDSEKEALLLENTLIKKHKPRYNLQFRDDKSYLSIKLSWKDKFPRIYITRQIKKDGSLYFGPYTSGTAARETADFIERFFRLRTCTDRELANRVRPCIQHQMGRCDAPCVEYINEENYRAIAEKVKLFLQGKKSDLLTLLEDQMKDAAQREDFEKAAQTRDLIGSIRETLEKQKVDRHNWLDQDVIGFYREGERMTLCLLLIREGKVWETRMLHLKGREDDDEMLENFLAQFYGLGDGDTVRLIPDEILLPVSLPSRETMEQILSERREKKVVLPVPQRGDKKDLIDLALRNAREVFERRSRKEEEAGETLRKLQELLGLENYPRRMECFDISNIGGQQAVGSLVCFVDGVPFKDGYRRFKIKTVHQPDDFSMMREVLQRRLIRGEQGDAKWEKPNLIVIDGGKGQLNVVSAAMKDLNVLGIDLISLAKERGGEDQDKVFLPGRKNPVLLGRHSNVLHLLMRIRDEAHRFAITYHKKLRAKAFLPSKSESNS